MATGQSLSQRERTDLLKGVPYFSPLDAETLSSIASVAVPRAYQPDEIIFIEGEPCAGLFVVHRGHVKIFKSSPEGREQILDIAGAGRSFNEVAVFDGGPNPASTQALDETDVCVIQRPAMVHLLERHPRLSQVVIASLAARCRMLVSLAEDLALRSVTARLAKLLLEQALDPENATPLTRQQIAARLGTIREMISRALRELEDEGVIRREGRQIVIVDQSALERRASQ